MQQTLSSPLEICGIGLHSGVNVSLRLLPSEENTGIVFCRKDIATKPRISALYSNVVDTRNCTCLGDGQGNLVSTIEHLMASLYMAGIDNAIIEIDNQEVPIMDGSGIKFYEALQSTPKTKQKSPRKILKIIKEVIYKDDKGNQVSLSPADTLEINFAIDFPSKVVGHQEFCGGITEDVFSKQIAPCRTFCEKYQVDYLKSIGLIKGGSLDNAVVLDGDNILNEGGFRVKNECVNHKVLDAIGDLYTSGYRVVGKLKADKTGHFHTNELLKILFSDSSNYKIEDEK